MRIAHDSMGMVRHCIASGVPVLRCQALPNHALNFKSVQYSMARCDTYYGSSTPWLRILTPRIALAIPLTMRPVMAKKYCFPSGPII